MNILTERRDLWFPEFIEFLGIDDERVKLMCANDFECALVQNQKEFRDAQEPNSNMTSVNASVTDNSNVFNFIVTDSAVEFRRQATKSLY